MEWKIPALILAGIVFLFIFQMVYLSLALAWQDRKTDGPGYYGEDLLSRERFKKVLSWQARVLWPLLFSLSRVSKTDLSRASFTFNGIAGPIGTCSVESFSAGASYRPRPEDVFVVSQMKSGTTWMQHLVLQVLTRGSGDLAGEGKALYGVSPWLESKKTLRPAQAPLLGIENPARLIKTHFPVGVCPFSREAKFIYVVRHPVSCLASCADFLSANLGPFFPGLQAVEEWFTSEESMWWGTWPSHVEGWWKQSNTHENVLFIRFEEMKTDLASVVGKLATLLNIRDLTEEEVDAITWKCSFEYMRKHKTAFEMAPPHILSLGGELFVRGSSDRHKDVPEVTRRRIMTWAETKMSGREFPFRDFYLESGP